MAHLHLEGPIPSISFVSHVLQRLNQRMGFSVIVKLLRRNISFRRLRPILQKLWNTIEAFQLIDIKENFFMVKFKLEPEY